MSIRPHPAVSTVRLVDHCHPPAYPILWYRFHIPVSQVTTNMTSKVVLSRFLPHFFLLFCATALSFSVGAMAQSTKSVRQILPLTVGWEFAQRGDNPEKWLPAQVPGDVHLDLLRNKLIPDPYYRDNEAKLQWIEDAAWSYRTTINVDADTLHRSHVELVFEGLDTTAHVSLNGKRVLDADNMFRCWRVDVKPFLLLGKNELRVDFDPPGKIAKALAEVDKTHSETQIPEKAYLRKAAYEYGWDWGPKFVTSGIWRPASLESWDEARIADVHISQPDVSADEAHLAVGVTIEAGAVSPAEVRLSYGVGTSRIESSERIVLHAGENVVTIPVNITHPSLWFPAGYGAQTLYSFDVSVNAEGHQQDATTVKTGLRSVQLRRERDQWGRSFALVVNGIPIFAKGANVIPFDSFPNRVTPEQYRRILQSAKDANMNMIRLWGGGYYESEEFYNLCDELGLMVWQDFMFASSWYPGDYDWKHNVELEARYQVDRLRNHPSLTLWSGNNEVESVLYAFLGSQSAEGKLQIWKNYLTTFSGILPNVVEREDPEVPYWPSSPSADYEPTSDAFQSGDSHDWSIWHGREPFKNYESHFARFNSEYGFQSFPELRTVESFTTPEDRANIFTPVMLAHQKNNEGNSIIHDYLLRDYAEPKDFASFLYVSQVLQAEGVKVGAEHMRRSRPRIMGSLFWQLNDSWPVASWSSIDYFGRWKALQYYARRFYSPVLVSPTLQDGNVDIYAVSDNQQPTPASLRIRVMTMDGKLVKQEQKDIVMPPLSSQQFAQWSLESIVQEHQDLSDIFLVADLSVNGKEVSRNLLYLEPTKLVHLTPTTVQSKLTQDGREYRLQLASPVLARDVYVTFGDQDATLSDNYIDLLPGEPVTLAINSKADLSLLRQKLTVVSLTEAFDSKAATSAQTANK
jgi:beta-mannosidase